MRVAAGLDETTFGTDAAAIAEAIMEADSGAGVLVLVDLGSAILSAEMALEFIDPELAARTKISSAPLVEGLIAAIVTASTSATLEEVCAEAVQGLAGKQDQLGDSPADSMATPAPTEGGLRFSWMIRNPHGLHARPAAALVSGLRGIDATIRISNTTLSKGPVSASSLTSIQTLGLRRGDLMEAEIIGPESEKAYSTLTDLAHSNFGESKDIEPSINATRLDHPRQDPMRTGHQIVIGEARYIAIDPDASEYIAGDVPTELARLNAAIDAVAQTLENLDKGSTLGIYGVQLLTLKDEFTLDELRSDIQGGLPAIEAVQDRFTSFAEQFEAIDDPYLRARAEDQRGIQRMLIRALLGSEVSPGLASGILIMPELDPITAGTLDPELCLGVITTSGGASGHGVLLAQSRGFPLLTGRADARTIPDGTLLAIDPVEGRLFIDPDDEELSTLKEEQSKRAAATAEAIRLAHKPAVTGSGTRIIVEANIASIQGAHDGLEAGAEGSGLVRTEVLFADWDHAPSVDEQAEVFIAIGKALNHQTITIRTWDPGGDKPLPFLPQDPEPNPMLGERGIRVMRRLPDLLDDQLAAILLASQETPVRVMFPMITSPKEMLWARSRLVDATRKVGGQIQAGMMVETPASALRARDFLDLADFISIGTNDLTQYTLAVDRGNSSVTEVAKGDRSAVWDLIAMAADAFKGRPVCVCGDIASDPESVARLIAAGVTELSVRAPLIGMIKQAVRAVPCAVQIRE
jgi:phosphocarrier protein FPr